jgi:hypothetical protein
VYLSQSDVSQELHFAPWQLAIIYALEQGQFGVPINVPSGSIRLLQPTTTGHLQDEQLENEISTLVRSAELANRTELSLKSTILCRLWEVVTESPVTTIDLASLHFAINAMWQKQTDSARSAK